MAVEKSILGLAGEFAVAAELCRRNTYAQLTLGYRKRTDLLVLSEAGRFHKVEVKAKQGRDWPNCRGIWEEGSFLVFVDFSGKEGTERPDFYVLTPQEWRAVVEAEVERYRTKHPDRRIEISDKNVAIFLDECDRQGKPYQGIGVSPELVVEHREAWSKITRLA